MVLGFFYFCLPDVTIVKAGGRALLRRHQAIHYTFGAVSILRPL